MPGTLPYCALMSGDAAPRRWWSVDLGGCLGGLTLAVLAVTPSLLPRPALLQGAIAGLAFGLGYLVGSMVWSMVRRFVGWRPSPRARNRLWTGYAVLWAVASVVLSSLSLTWQNEIRRGVEMPLASSVDLGSFLMGFVPLVLVLLLIGKGVLGAARALGRRFGPVVGTLGAAAIVVLPLVALVLGGVSAINSIYLERNGSPSDRATEPASTYRSAGPQSAIRWETLGRHGGDFVGGGPSAARISEVIGRPAKEPIRVYAGLKSAPTVRERAALVVSELERTGAFDRSVLVVATATGSGWLEPQAVDSVEYLHAGDTAIAGIQYSAAPSWVSFLFDQGAPIESSRVLFDAVHAKWAALPEGRRPKLVVYGLSLGALGSQAVFTDVADIRARTDGAMFVGSPHGADLWRTLQGRRDPGSPAWQPVLDGGREVRWMSQAGDEQKLSGPWQPPRVLYLQHATDPVTWLSADLLWRRPDWLRADQRSPELNPAMRWIPGVTAIQVTIDQFGGTAVPARFGHNFGDVMTVGWEQVTGGGGLDDAAMGRIQTVIEEMASVPSYPSASYE